MSNFVLELRLKLGRVSETEHIPEWSLSICLGPCCAQSHLKSAARNSESSWKVYEVTVFYSLMHLVCKCCILSALCSPFKITSHRP